LSTQDEAICVVAGFWALNWTNSGVRLALISRLAAATSASFARVGLCLGGARTLYRDHTDLSVSAFTPGDFRLDGAESARSMFVMEVVHRDGVVSQLSPAVRGSPGGSARG
jgi:hypothetical protein